MPVCYYNSDFNTSYRCDYEIENEKISVTVEYDIMDEITPVNGTIVYTSSTKFKERDILIVDYEKKNNYLLKDACFAGINNIFGSPDEVSRTSFVSNVYFSHSDFRKLMLIPETPKISKIKIVSNSLLNWIDNSSLTTSITDDELTYKLSRNFNPIHFQLNQHNIAGISIYDNWKTMQKPNDRSIHIEFFGTIEIELSNRIKYTDVVEYLLELIVYMQLFAPDKFMIDTFSVMVNDTYYSMSVPLIEVAHKERYVAKTTESTLAKHLERCYMRIPFRIGNNNIRNIRYIILKTSRSLEDNFLLFYRFIECYYKSREVTHKNFVSRGIIDHCTTKHFESEDAIENYSREIISLRNHYVHSGYHIRNASLKIRFMKIDGKENPKNYTVNNVDARWIYDRTYTLYRIAIDLIFKEMLRCDTYKFDKHF